MSDLLGEREIRLQPQPTGAAVVGKGEIDRRTAVYGLAQQKVTGASTSGIRSDKKLIRAQYSTERKIVNERKVENKTN